MDERQLELKQITKEIRMFGYQATSLKDYPTLISSVIFLKGCNLTCSFCHNLNTMLNTEEFCEDTIRYSIYNAISNKFSDAIVISGGEPTIHGTGLIHLIEYLKKYSDKFIKLDTNGTNPAIVEYLLEHKLIDFIAMDIKHDFEDYPTKVAYEGDIANLYSTVALINKSKIPHQFRTTMYKGMSYKDMAFLSKNFPNIKLQEYKESK